MINELLAIDLGDAKTGVARMNRAVGIPEPLPLLTTQAADLIAEILELARKFETEQILIGLPTSLHSGQDSEQTKKIRAFADELSKASRLPVKLTDESLSTVDSKKWSERYPEASEDSLAACVILERHLEGAATDGGK